MASSDLRKQLGALTQQFVDGVLKALRTVPLSELTVELAGSHAPAKAPAPKAPAKAPPAKKPAPKKAAPKKAAAKPAPAKKQSRKIVRRTGNEIDKITSSILKILKKHGKPTGAAEIAKEIGGGIKSGDLSFPMGKLREQKLVDKQGERTQAVYTLTEKGAAFEESSASG